METVTKDAHETETVTKDTEKLKVSETDAKIEESGKAPQPVNFTVDNCSSVDSDTESDEVNLFTDIDSEKESMPKKKTRLVSQRKVPERSSPRIRPKRGRGKADDKQSSDVNVAKVQEKEVEACENTETSNIFDSITRTKGDVITYGRKKTNSSAHETVLGFENCEDIFRTDTETEKAAMGEIARESEAGEEEDGQEEKECAELENNCESASKDSDKDACESNTDTDKVKDGKETESTHEEGVDEDHPIASPCPSTTEEVAEDRLIPSDSMQGVEENNIVEEPAEDMTPEPSKEQPSTETSTPKAAKQTKPKTTRKRKTNTEDAVTTTSPQNQVKKRRSKATTEVETLQADAPESTRSRAPRAAKAKVEYFPPAHSPSGPGVFSWQRNLNQDPQVTLYKQCFGGGANPEGEH